MGGGGEESEKVEGERKMRKKKELGVFFWLGRLFFSSGFLSPYKII